MAKDYVGLVKRVENYNSIKTELHKEYKDGYISKKDFQSELEVNKAKLRNLLEVAKAEGGIASEVLSGKSTLEDFVSSQYKEVRKHIESFKDFKQFKPNKKLDRRTQLILRELYDNYDKKIIKTNPMLTENIKRFGEKKSLFNPKMYDYRDALTMYAGLFYFPIGADYLLSTDISSITYWDLLAGISVIVGLTCINSVVANSLMKPKNWKKSNFVLSRLKDESASMVVKARIFDDVVKDVYSDMKK